MVTKNTSRASNNTYKAMVIAITDAQFFGTRVRFRPIGTLDHGNSTWLDVKFEVNRGVNLEGRLSASRGYFQDYYAASDFEVILYKAYPMRPPTMGARINTQTLASAVPPEEWQARCCEQGSKTNHPAEHQ